MPRKLLCPKCGGDAFKISLSERDETYDALDGRRRVQIINILNITCAKCGWNQHFRR